MILRVADIEKEPLNAIIDSDSVCFPPTMFRILKMIPVFNIIYGFWSQNGVQLDTIFESLKNCDVLLLKLQDIENQGKKHVYANLVNHNEELSVLPIEPLKDMLFLYKRYRDEAEIVLKDSDLMCIKEYFYEFVRRNCFSEKNGRLITVYFYENLGVAAVSNKNSERKSGKFCEIEIVEQRSLDRYDQSWLTDIKPTCIFKECEESVKNYWKGEMTEHPKIEYLFSGKYFLRELN